MRLVDYRLQVPWSDHVAAGGRRREEGNFDLAPPLDVLCHGDMHIRHLLLGDDGELRSVIDWGDGGRGPRALGRRGGSARAAPPR